MIFNTNPYITDIPVGGTQSYIGRREVLQKVLEVLRSPHQKGMVIYGQRHIGKTSVLLEMAARLPEKGPYLPIYFDLKDKGSLSSDQILHAISSRILYSFSFQPFGSRNADFMTGFQEDFLLPVLSRLPEESVLVLLLDEFHVLDTPGNEQAGSAFFSYLRELMAADTRRIKFIFVAGRWPEELSAECLSLFRGILFHHISLFSHEETAALVHLSKQNTSLKWSDDMPAQIHNLTGGHPFLSQMLCQVIWDRLYDNDPEDVPIVSSQDLTAGISESLELAGNSLKELWDSLRPVERVAASALAEFGTQIITREQIDQCLKKISSRMLIGNPDHAPRVLEEWDLIEPEGEGYRVRVEMLRRWIARRKPAARAQDEKDRKLAAANSLFKTAQKLSQEGKAEDALHNLRQAILLDPSHQRAKQLLVETCLTLGFTDEARDLLESLYESNPWAARPRLVQVLLRQAKEKTSPDDRLTVYERVLELEPWQPEAVAEYRKTYQMKGDIAYKNNDLNIAMEAYKRAGSTQKIAQVSKRLQLETVYAQALDALDKNEREKASSLLAEILSVEPSFREATRYMHLAVTGSDFPEKSEGNKADTARERFKSDLNKILNLFRSQKT